MKKNFLLAGLLFCFISCSCTKSLLAKSKLDFFLKKAKPHRFYDETGRAGGFQGEFENYLKWICNESGVDMRIMLVKNLEGKNIEQFAADQMNELGIGKTVKHERGALLLYDVQGGQVRMEVGYGLESYFPDAFVQYVIRSQLDGFFRSGNPRAGLLEVLDAMQERIREAVLNQQYDPNPSKDIKTKSFLSGGGGGTTPTKIDNDPSVLAHGQLSPEGKKYFSAQRTVEDAYQRYREWIANGVYDPDINLFTPQTRDLLKARPRSEEEFLSRMEANKPHAVLERGNYAILYFTKDPIKDPWLFRKTSEGWQTDIIEKEHHTINQHFGGEYSWDFYNRDCEFCKVFQDRIVYIDGYLRLKGADNRPLPVHGDCF